MRKRVPKLWRLRAHPPTFDWHEARRRAKKGESMNVIARDMGVDRRSVNRVVKMSEAHVKAAMEMTDPEARARLVTSRDKVPCPRCGRPKSRYADHCRDCTNDLRLENAPMDLVKVPGIKRIELRAVSMGRIVLVDGQWGVMMGQPRRTSARYRVVDFWDGGRRRVPAKSVVEVAPSTLVSLAGEVQGGEDIG